MTEIIDFATAKRKAACAYPEMVEKLRDLADKLETGQALGVAVLVCQEGVSAAVVGNVAEKLAIGKLAVYLADCIDESVFGGDE